MSAESWRAKIQERHRSKADTTLRTTYKVLWIDNQKELFEEVQKLLSEFEFTQVKSLSEGYAALRREWFQLIVVNDDNLVSASADIELLSNAAKESRFIVTTDCRSTLNYSRVLESSSFDFLVQKPISPRLLADLVLQSVQNYLREIPAVWQEANDEFGQLANEYFEHLPVELLKLKQYLQEEKQCTLSSEDAIRIAHRLRGTGTSFGCRWLTASAGKIEETLSMRIDTKTRSELVQIVNDLINRASLPDAKPADTEKLARIAPATPPRVLIVHSNAAKAERLASSLAKQEYVVTTFLDGLFAYEVLDDVRPDLIVLGPQILQANGMPLLAAIRQSPVWKQVRVLIDGETNLTADFASTINADDRKSTKTNPRAALHL